MNKYENIKFKKLELRYIDAVTATPYAVRAGSDVLLRYPTHDDFDMANEVRFTNAICHRIGDPNDEGFYSDGTGRWINSTIYNVCNFPDLDFGNFYEVTGRDLMDLSQSRGFVPKRICSGDDLKKMRHYLYFMKDATFECLSEGYSETGLRPGSILEESQSDYTGEDRWRP